MTMSRSDAAKVAANTRWAFEADRSSATRNGRAAFLAKFEQRVDPDGVLTPEERTKRAKNLLSAHMTRVRASRHRRMTRVSA